MNIVTDPPEAEGRDLVMHGFRGGYKQHPANFVAMVIVIATLIMIILLAVWVLSVRDVSNGESGGLVSACGVCGTYEYCDGETGKCIIAEGRCYNNDDCKFNEHCETKIHKCIPIF